MPAFTLGVEEEYHLVDAETYALRAEPGAIQPTRKRLVGCGEATAELTTTQVEIATPICSTLDEVRSRLVTARRAAAGGAGEVGCRILAAGSHPFAPVGDLRPWLALLLALTGSSPFWEGLDTRYASFRTVWFGRWAMERTGGDLVTVTAGLVRETLRE